MLNVEPDIIACAARIKLAVFDVDGVLTDGRIILGPKGEEYKVFHVRDGHGLVMLGRAGIKRAVITGRRSGLVTKRMAELGIEHVYQGTSDKRTALVSILEATGIAPEHTCYVGDDEPDIAAMELVGFPIAVADAAPSVRARATWTTDRCGGKGAVREVCDRIFNAAELSCLQPNGMQTRGEAS